MKRTDKAAAYASLIANCTAYLRETKPNIDNPLMTYQLMAPLCADEPQEGVYVILLNSKNRPIKAPIRVTQGLVNSCLIHSREVFRLAIMENAVNIIIAHNHPSGDPSPSTEDVRQTQILAEAGRIIGIPVVDHVIIGKPADWTTGYCSLRENGLVNFA